MYKLESAWWRRWLVEADVLVLAGEPIAEPIVASGTWVMNSDAELAAAEADYAAGEFGRPWPHTLSDDEWRAHVDEYGVPGASDARRAYDVAAP